MKLHRVLFLVIIPTVLLLCAFATYQFASLKGLFRAPPDNTLSFEKYTLTKDQQAWPFRFDFQETVEYNS
jgi:hypothetical protein